MPAQLFSIELPVRLKFNNAKAMLAKARERGHASSCEARKWILASQIKLAEALELSKTLGAEK